MENPFLCSICAIGSTFCGWIWDSASRCMPGNPWPVSSPKKLPYTLTVNFYAVLLAIPLGLALGIYAALRKNKWQDHAISTTVMVFISVPSYVYAFLVQYLLCHKWGLFPLTAASRQDAPFFSIPMFLSMFPAVLSLAFGTVAGLTRFTRAD